MDVVAAVSGYISRMVSAGDAAVPGTASAKMKILLLDSETVGIALYSWLWPQLTFSSFPSFLPL